MNRFVPPVDKELSTGRRTGNDTLPILFKEGFTVARSIVSIDELALNRSVVAWSLSVFDDGNLS